MQELATYFPPAPFVAGRDDGLAREVNTRAPTPAATVPPPATLRNSRRFIEDLLIGSSCMYICMIVEKKMRQKKLV
jgi:hypothetical protein